VSFSFNAMGTKREVLAQLARTTVSGSKIGVAARDLVAAALDEEAENRLAGPGYECRYTVNASGHSGGGSALQLSLTVQPCYVPAAVPAGADAGEPAAGDDLPF
jgi:hypothetical protein